MSFKLFIYYCALCGGWAAFIAWALVTLSGIVVYEGRGAKSEIILESTLVGGALGLLLGLGVGTLDALLNSVGTQRVLRPLVCLVVGVLGGMLGAAVGEALFQFVTLSGQTVPVLKIFGWILAGTAIGVSIGVFDLLRAFASGGSGMGLAIRKVINGVIGGSMGGLVGGFLFALLAAVVALPRGSLALGLVVLGACIGLLIGIAQVILKEAWVRVESGFKAGRELILSKEETSIGRAESCDIGLYGDNQVERMHARILLKNDRYLLTDADTPAGTYLNGQRISGPTPLRTGDRIGVGRAILRFGERQKR